MTANFNRAHVLVSIARLARETGVGTEAVRAAIRRARLGASAIKCW